MNGTLVAVFVAIVASSVVAEDDGGRIANDFATATDHGSLVESANAALRLRESEVITLEIDRTPGTAQQVGVVLEGEPFVLNLTPHSVRSDQYEVKAQVAGGELITVPAGPIRTVRGVVAGIEGSKVAGAVLESGLYVVIELPDDRRFWIEPLAPHNPQAGADDHVVYTSDNVISAGGTCATVDRLQAVGNLDLPSTLGGGCSATPCIAELACDADVEYFVRWGSVAGVENRINLVINTINLQYESQVGIVHEITTILVRTSEPDPYSAFGSGALLCQFILEWTNNQQAIQRDVAHLFTDRNITGSIIGQAADIGGTGICVSQGCCGCGQFGTQGSYCYTQSDFTNNFSCVTDLSAHEMGHLWGAFHCSCPGNTMNTPLACANNFSQGSINSIVNYRNTRTCLSDVAPKTVFPFFDSFPDETFDPGKWVAGGATVDNQGNGEPSPPFSARINNGDVLLSGFMDTIGVEAITVQYWWQRTGDTGGSPEEGEDLALEYRSSSGSWNLVAQHPGEGDDDLPYEFHCVTLPSDAAHEGLQIRFRMLGTAIVADNFFIDDVAIVADFVPAGIETQPTDDFTCVGETGVFTVVPDGDPPFAYQWKRSGVPLQDGGNISGALTDTLTISPAEPGDFAFYTVQVTNDCSTIESAAAQLVEIGPIEITTQPMGGTVEIGDAFAFFITASGQPTYQWFHNNVAISGATSFFLSLTNIQCDDGGLYRADLENDCSMVSTDTVELIVEGDCTDLVPPVIVHQLGLEGQTRPHSGYLDPRLESTDGNALDLGIAEVAILFSETVEDVGEPGGGLSTDAFTVTQTGGGDPPLVTSVDTSQMPRVVLTLSRPITLQEWTTIQATVQDTAETPNVIVNGGNQGPGVDEGDRVDIAFMPADIDQSSGTFPLDLLRFRQMFLGQFSNPQGLNEDYIDTDRNGLIQVLDLLRYRQMLTGVSPATQVWAEESMNADRP